MRPEKQLLLDELNEKIKGAKALVVTKYQKLSPDLSWNFAKTCAAQGCFFEVVKKRILKKALQAHGLEVQTDAMPGHIGVFFIGSEPMDGLKLIFKFKEENDKVFEFVTGKLEEKIYASHELEELAQLPSMQELRAQLLAVFEAPMAQTISILQNVLGGLLYCLENKNQKESS
ncbi:MAG: 50S ribosomal protein L10 [Parachlamydiales bacterium]|jgi:large subunit ribosomal protein L10